MKSFFIFLVNIVLIFLNSNIIASEREGFGLAIEGGSYKPIYDSSDKDLKTSSLYGFSLDYQWQIGKSFSFSIMGVEHGGKSDSPPKSNHNYYKSGFIGAGIKAWIGSFFIGMHSGSYYLTWIENTSSYTNLTQKSGRGFGLVIETESGLIIAAFSESSGIFKYEEIENQKVEGIRILLGYRW